MNESVSHSIETLDQHLKRLYADHYTRITSHMCRVYSASETAYALSHHGTLATAFLWGDTPEGHTYWLKLQHEREVL